MEDTQEDKKNEAGMDWKKNKGFSDSERLSLRIDVKEANRYQAKKGTKKISALSPTLKSLRKKNRNPYDDDENDDVFDDDVLRALRELQLNATEASNGDTTLLDSLNPSEKQQLLQNTTIENKRNEENAGKMDALLQSDSMSKRAGISEMSRAEFSNRMQEAIYNPRRTKEITLEENISKRVGLSGKITKHNLGKVVEGVKKINEVTNNCKVKSVTFDDAVKIGKKTTSKNATAELILKKSGQTARLSEIKMKQAQKDSENKKPTRSYSKEMKELLKASLNKKVEVR